MVVGQNPWANRFNDLLEINEIKRRADRPARPLSSLEKDTVEHACARIESEFQEIFVTTSRVAEIFKGVIETAQSHSLSQYPDVQSFLRRCYDDSKEIAPYFPSILTGPPGTGKTQLGRALMRILPKPSVIQPDQLHPQFPLISAEHISINGIGSLNRVLEKLAPPRVGLGGRSAAAACARWQYKCGTSLLIADELQFITQSLQASALIARVLLGLSYVLLPTLFIANYSLIYRLDNRPPEERQRLLGKPLILLLPELALSTGWSDILKEYQRAVPGIYQFDFVEKRTELWALCAGIKRELAKLLVLAYRQCRRRKNEIVGWDDIERAYHSADFFVQRKDIEALVTQAITGQVGDRNDLRCPIPTDPTLEEGYFQSLQEVRQMMVNDEVIRGARTPAERKAAKQSQALTPASLESSRKPAAERRNRLASAKDLLENSARHKKNLTK